MPPTRRLVLTVALAVVVAACSAPSPSPAAPNPATSVPPPSTSPPPARTLRLDDSGVYGNLYFPASAQPAHTTPAVLLIGGSEGGLGSPLLAADLAGRGFAVLAVAYFGEKNEPRLPATLTDIPIEYFATAARRLAAEPEVDPAHVAVWGGSRGSEAAVLLAGHYPALVHGAVLESPSSVANSSIPRSPQPAWTLRGAPVPAAPDHDYGDPDPADAQDALLPIPAIIGPVVTICGGLDPIWPSCDYSTAIHSRSGPAARVTTLTYPDAGHSPVSSGIYAAAGVAPPVRFGGSAAADVAAADDAVPRVVAALRSG